MSAGGAAPVGTLLGMEVLSGAITTLSLYLESASEHPIPVLSYWLAKAPRCALTLHSPAASLKPTTGVHGSHKKHYLIAWLWWPVGLCSWVTIGETIFGKLPSPGHCTNNRMKHIQSIREKGLFLVLVLQLEGQISGMSHLEATKAFLGNTGWGRPSLHTPLALVQHTGTSQKGAYIHLN